MKTDALKEKGLSQEQIDYIMAENGKDIKALQKSVNDLTAERDNFKAQYEAAQATLKGFEGIDVEKIQKEVADWKKKAEDTEREYTAKLNARDFDDALKAEMETVKFSSEAARRAVMAEIREAKLNMKDGKILGLNDLVAQIKERDASAFVDEKKESLEQNKAKFTSPVKGSGGAGAITKADIMAIKDATERQAAIAAHIDLFT